LEALPSRPATEEEEKSIEKGIKEIENGEYTTKKKEDTRTASEFLGIGDPQKWGKKEREEFERRLEALPSRPATEEEEKAIEEARKSESVEMTLEEFLNS